MKTYTLTLTCREVAQLWYLWSTAWTPCDIEYTDKLDPLDTKMQQLWNSAKEEHRKEQDND